MRFLRYVLLLFAVLLILAILVSVLFGGDKKSPAKPSEQLTQASFASAASTDSSVVFLTDGVINSNENHRQIQITVSKSLRVINIIQGYQGNIIQTQSYANNEQAYNSFLNSIYVNGFTAVNTNAPVTNIAGQCALGYRYTYTSNNIPNTPTNVWATTCNKNGTSKGNVPTLNQLFQFQIPNYQQIVSTVNLNN